MIVLVALAIGVGVGVHLLRGKAAAAQAQMDALKAQTAAYRNELTSNEARMRQPQNKAVLERAQFLNTVFAEKSFSWTAVMMDLETVLPAGLQVTSIDPALDKEGGLTIRVRVSGDRDRAVQFVRNLEHSRRFLEPRIAAESLNTSQLTGAQAQMAGIMPGGVEFDILSGYNPLPAGEKRRLAANERKAEAAESRDAAESRVAAEGRKTPAPMQPAPVRPGIVKPLAPMPGRAPVPGPPNRPQPVRPIGGAR